MLCPKEPFWYFAEFEKSYERVTKLTFFYQ